MDVGEQDPKRSLLGMVKYVAAAIAALALFVTNINTLHEAWCNNVGTFCQEPINWAKSDEVYVFSGGTSRNDSDECKTHTAQACVRSSDPKKKLVGDTAYFDASERSGAVYLDGNKGTPPNPDPINTSNIGWFLEPDKQSPDEICATVFARTSACETKVDIRGRLMVRLK